MMHTLSKIAKTALCIPLVWLVTAGHADASVGREVSIHTAIQAARQQGVPEAVIVDLLADGFEVGLSVSRMASLVDLLSQIRQADLPLPPFLAKIHEGLHKQVDPQQLTTSLHRRINAYQFVRRELFRNYPEIRNPDQSDLTALVESLDLGLSHESLSRLFEQATGVEPFMLSIAAKNQALLDQLSFPRRLTEDMLLTGLKHRRLTTHWAGLFKVAAAARRKGVPDDRFAAVVKQVLRSGGDLTQVLKALDFTTRDVRRGPYWRPAREVEDQP